MEVYALRANSAQPSSPRKDLTKEHQFSSEWNECKEKYWEMDLTSTLQSFHRKPDT